MTPRAAQPELFAASPLVVLGIDPGSTITGWGVVERRGRELRRVASGVLRPKRDARLDYRLAVIRDGVLRLLDEHKPDLVGVEAGFVPPVPKKKQLTPKEALELDGKIRNSLTLASARGAIFAAIGCCELKLGEQMPWLIIAGNTVKACVAGNGRAPKAAVAEGARRVLGLGLEPLKPDESDALGVAIAAALTWRPR